MCGIIGYKGKSSAFHICLQGLKALEYRGYDSWGIVALEQQLLIKKAVGAVSEASLPESVPASVNIGIGHTRWATHGAVTEANAHPHADCQQRFFIVHNGVLEHWEPLKKALEQKGHQFHSETDSEVIVHLLEETLKASPHASVLDALFSVLEVLQGSYAFVVLDTKTKRLYAAKQKSPLLVGKANHGYFFASDATAFLKHTKMYYPLQDGEVIVLDDALHGYDLQSRKEKPLHFHYLDWQYDDLTKEGYDHYMLKEIHEQPRTLEKTFAHVLQETKLLADLFTKAKRLVFIACGTSWHAALLGKYWFERLTKIPVVVEYASEFLYRDPVLFSDDLIIALSQSGETADTLAAVRFAKTKAPVLAIVNTPGSSLAREATMTFVTDAGPEIGVASTKAFMAQMTVLFWLAVSLSRIAPEEKRLLKQHFLELPQKMKDIFAYDYTALVTFLIAHDHALYLGRDIFFPLALEGALKLKEIAYIHAEGYPAAEMKHGPLALIDQHMPVVVLAPRDQLWEKIKSNMQEVHARGGKLILLSDTPLSFASYFIPLPKTHQLLWPFLGVLPLQLLAYHAARARGLNVDKPRNLAKSVTVE